MQNPSEKDALRAAYKQARMDFASAGAGAEAAAAVACSEIDQTILRLLLASDVYRFANTIFTYISVGAETDTRSLIERAFTDGKTVCVPRTKGRGKDAQMDAVPLTWDQYRAMMDADCGAFGIPEPPDLLPVLAPERLDLMIVPSLAVDGEGFRLGYGGGYYDRYIEQARKAKAGGAANTESERPVIIAIQRSAFVTKEILPREAHDQKSDVVLTELGFTFSFPC